MVEVIIDWEFQRCIKTTRVGTVRKISWWRRYVNHSRQRNRVWPVKEEKHPHQRSQVHRNVMMKVYNFCVRIT